MNPLLKWAGIAVASLAAFAALAILYVYVASQIILDRTHPKRPSAVHAVATAQAIARGAHLAVVTTCTNCHGNDLTGTLLPAPGSTIYAANLTLLTNNRSDADFDRVIRQGIRPDGRSILVMPSHAYADLTDEEVASIIAYLRSLKPRGRARPNIRLGLAVRAGLVAGVFKTETRELADAKAPLDLGPRYEQGRHLARVVCATCHGTNLDGLPDDPVLPSPNLVIVAAYDRSAFRTLMRTGKAAGNREVGMMSTIARENLSGLTDEEVNAIYDYLVARGNALTAGGNTPNRK